MKKLRAIVFIVPIILLALVQEGCRHDKPLVINIPCDTAHITFSGSVMPILNTSCRLSGCHLGSNPPNNVSFDNYTAVKAQLYLVNGTPELIGVITHAIGFTPMPKNSTMLDTCSINKIIKWVADGAPNN